MEEENKDTIEKNETVEISEANNEEIKIADDVVSVIAGKAVETMTGLTVTSVNVHVQGVNIPEEKEEPKNEEEEEK